ncbi:hypothetical protein JHK86_053079 [Glycine max]|nr:hypothetical protein JHK86_053079 [Glycine max]
MDESKVGKLLSLVVKGSTNRLANNRSSLALSFYPLSPSKLSPTSPMFPLEALSLSAKVKTLIVVDDSAGGVVSGGSVHVTLREEALRGTTVALEDFREVTNGFRVEIDVQARR